MALSPFEHLRLCTVCDGLIVRPKGTGGATRLDGTPLHRFQTDAAGVCVGCRGSGFENATAREAFEREHRQSAQPARDLPVPQLSA